MEQHFQTFLKKIIMISAFISQNRFQISSKSQQNPIIPKSNEWLLRIPPVYKIPQSVSTFRNLILKHRLKLQLSKKPPSNTKNSTSQHIRASEMEIILYPGQKSSTTEIFIVVVISCMQYEIQACFGSMAIGVITIRDSGIRYRGLEFPFRKWR